MSMAAQGGKQGQTSAEIIAKHVSRIKKETEFDPRANNESQLLAGNNYEFEERERHNAEVVGLKERNRDLRHNRKLRSSYARLVFCYLVCYSIFVGVVIVASGWSILSFTLHEDVLKYLVGSTAAAAIGLVYAVTNGLFNGVGKK